MVYVTPHDWLDGEIIPESYMQEISDNLAFLKTPTQTSLVAGATTNTTSASFVDITGVTVTQNYGAYAIEAIFSGSFSISTAASAGFTVLVDGVNQGDSAWGVQFMTFGAAATTGIGFNVRIPAVTAASHTIKMQWKTSAGTLVLQPGWRFSVTER
jgi:hypothetical protein